MKENLSAVVFVIIEGVPCSEGKIPLVQEKNKPYPRMWKLPGGTVDEGEWPEVTAYREIHEEMGVLIKPLHGQDKIYDQQKTGKYGPFRFIVFVGQYLRGEVRPGDEIEKIGFFSREEIADMIKGGKIVPTHIAPLKKYFGLE